MLLIQTERDFILKPLQAVTGIVERRHTLPILSNVLIQRSKNSLSFMATDLEIQISTITPCEDEQVDFAITVSAKKLQDICRALPDNMPVKLEGLDGRIQVKAGKSKFSLQTLPSEDFPVLADLIDTKGSIDIGQKTFKQLLSLVQYAMAQQDIRYYLNGLLLVVEGNSLTVVATDGHRLSLASMPLEQSHEKQEVILPRKTIIELSKLLADADENLSLELGQNQAKFTFSNIVLISKIVDGKFPDYNRVIPASTEKKISLPRLQLLQSLQRVSILSNEKFRGVRIVLTKDTLSIFCNNNEQEEAQEELEIQYNGDPLDIGFNVTYLMDVLNNLDCAQIECGFGDANSSALFTIPDNTNFKYVVMPMRI